MNLTNYQESATCPKAAKFTYALILVTLFIISHSHSAHGSFSESQNVIVDSSLLTRKIRSNRTVTVDANGNEAGHFKSVQAAIDHVPDDNDHWVIIDIRKGVFREKVTVPRNKPYIFMRGSGRGKTSIVWSHGSNEHYDSATFKVEAPYFIAFGISFKNEAATSFSHKTNDKSVAAFVGSDKAAFYQCAFFSYHNTLYDFKGRHYYDSCYIQGSMDFIFGRGQAVFHDCEIFVIGDGRVEIRGGSITANYRQSQNEHSGFVFLKGRVYGNRDQAYLGRPKGQHSRVVFAHTYLSRSVIDHGWTNYSYPGRTHNVYHGEYKCHGPGSATENRAHWSKQLSGDEAAPFLSMDFIQGREWLPHTFT